MSDLGMNIALSGMQAQMAGLDVVSNDLANVNTAGYVREQVDLAPIGSNAVGDGVAVEGISQVSSAVVTAGQRAAAAAAAQANATASMLTQAQGAFPEPGPSGLQAQLSGLWSAFDTLAATPTSLAARQQVLDQAQVVASTLNGEAGSLQNETAQAAAQVVATVHHDNTLLSQVAALNQAIPVARASGQAAALEDQRSALLDQLATDLGVTTTTTANGAVNVDLGGVALVQGATAAQLSVETTGLVARYPSAAGGSGSGGSGSGGSGSGGSGSGPVQVVAGGTVGGLEGGEQAIAGLRSELDGVAQDLATTLAQALAGGTYYTPTTSGSTTSWTPTAGGPPLFVGSNGSASGVSAATITVNPTLLNDPYMIAAGGPPTSSASGPVYAGPNDGSNAQLIAAIGSDAVDSANNLVAPGTSVNGAPSPDANYQAFVGALGTAVSQATTAAQAAANQSQAASTAEQAVSGVDPNEELTAMVQYQNAYQASAKVLATIDATLQSLLAAVA